MNQGCKAYRKTEPKKYSREIANASTYDRTPSFRYHRITHLCRACIRSDRKTLPTRAVSDDNPERAFDVAEKVKFACIQPEDGTLCDAVFAPLVIVRRAGKVLLEGHLVKTNPLYELLMQGSLHCRLVFQAADGYVSPSIYAEKPKSGKVVPTWNYVAAQFFGRLKKSSRPGSVCSFGTPGRSV